MAMADRLVARFEVYRAREYTRIAGVRVGRAGAGWRWRLKKPNGRIIADGGESYTRKSDAMRAVKGVAQVFLKRHQGGGPNAVLGRAWRESLASRGIQVVDVEAQMSEGERAKGCSCKHDLPNPFNPKCRVHGARRSR